jgi:hypothetical protein
VVEFDAPASMGISVVGFLVLLGSVDAKLVVIVVNASIATQGLFESDARKDKTQKR